MRIYTIQLYTHTCVIILSYITYNTHSCDIISKRHFKTRIKAIYLHGNQNAHFSYSVFTIILDSNQNGKKVLKK